MKTNCPLCKKWANEIGVHGSVHSYYCHDCNVEFSVIGGKATSICRIEENGNLTPLSAKRNRVYNKLTKEVLASKMSKFANLKKPEAFARIADELGYTKNSIRVYYYALGVNELLN